MKNGRTQFAPTGSRVWDGDERRRFEGKPPYRFKGVRRQRGAGRRGRRPLQTIQNNCNDKEERTANKPPLHYIIIGRSRSSGG